MNEIVKTDCNVGSVEQTQAQIDASIVAEKKAEINANTDAKIFKTLGVDNKEKAFVVQITQLREAVAFLATKIDKRTLTEAEKAKIDKRLAEFVSIKKMVHDGKKAKGDLWEGSVKKPKVIYERDQ